MYITIYMSKSNSNIRCHFTKYYEEPKEKYNIISLSLFYNPQYIRQYHKTTKNIAYERQRLFIYNLLINIYNLECGFFGKKLYIRIFYDDSVYKFKYKGSYIWKEFIDSYKNHPKIQFVNYKCPDFLGNDNFHLNLFGTLMRLYPFFEENDNINMVISADIDNFYTNDYLNELIKFDESDYNFNVFCSKYEVSFYHYFSNNKSNINCYFRSGMISSKIKFKMMFWDYILTQLKTYTNKNFSNILDILNKEFKNVRPNREIKSYKKCEYGIDEIIINYYLKKILKKYNAKIRIVRYKPLTQCIFSMMNIYLEWNYKNNSKNEVTKILKELIYLENKNFNTSLKNNKSNNINYLIEKFKSTYNNKSNEFDNYYNILLILRKYLPEFKKMKMPESILNFIENCNKNDYDVPDFKNYFSAVCLPKYLS